MTEVWQTKQVGGSGGCMEDGKGTLYMSGGTNNIVAVDGSVPGAVEILGGGLIAPEVILGAVKDKTRHEEECHQGHQENQ
jgi:hypothetical protein